MAKITTNCLCGYRFEVNLDGEDTYYCHKCKRQYARYYNPKEHRYEFDLIGKK